MMKKKCLLMATVMSMFIVSTFAKEAYKVKLPGAKVLFNGKDLSGWKGSDKFWSVKDGVIHGTTHENRTRGNTFLILDAKDVEDFHLVYEARCFGNNSGVMYRSKVVNEENFVMAGYQCDLHPKPAYVAMIYGEKMGRRGIIITRGQKMEIDKKGKKTIISSETPTPVDIREWNTYEVICKGNHIIHKLNGKVAIDLIDNDKSKLLKGKIGLQLHAGKKMKVDFRNIRLKRLKK
ncbi:MAG: DUF1080 domain-containing protein [Lentisphaeraceae bacterium]|nr:DUF1080 domain-containing protein [Lentisphaeraceae bacterium]